MHNDTQNHGSAPRDTLYAHEQSEVPGFVFDQKVVDVFPDMINRSVPGYSAIIMMIGQLAARFAQADSRCYDLGCSLGAASFAMARNIQEENVEIVAVDSSQAMIEKLRTTLARETPTTPVSLIEGDILETGISEASLVVLNFTLQFIPLEKRQALLQKIHDGMLPGGVLVLSEKIHFEEQSYNELLADMHHFFKASQGYSELEIAQKRSALEKVLLPETLEQHNKRLRDCGFRNANLWFQCFNFASLLAFK